MNSIQFTSWFRGGSKKYLMLAVPFSGSNVPKRSFHSEIYLSKLLLSPKLCTSKNNLYVKNLDLSLLSLSEKSFFGLALLIKTKRTLKHWLIKRQEQVGHSTTRNLSDLDTQVTRTELDECLDICMRHTCIACKFCKWRWAPMQFGTLSDYGVRDYILVTEFSSALFFYLIIYPLSMVGHIHVNICLGLKRAENP